MQGEYRLISSIAGKCCPVWLSLSFFLLWCRLVSSNVGEYVSFLLAIFRLAQLVGTRRLSSSNQLRTTWIWAGASSSSASFIIKNRCPSGEMS